MRCGSRSFYKIEDFKHRCRREQPVVYNTKYNIGRHNTVSDSVLNVDFKRFAPSPKEAVRVYDNLRVDRLRERRSLYLMYLFRFRRA
jgi:hypothetical protein